MSDLHDQVSRAFAALQQLNPKEEDELIPDDPSVTVIFQLWEPFNSNIPYPTLFEIRHPIYTDETLPVRIITKDPHDEWKQKFRDAVPPFPIKTYSISKWRKRFTVAADRRQLMKETRVFCADGRIGHILDDIIGADFYKKKKMPVIVDISGDDIIKPIEHVLECTAVMFPKDQIFSATIGKLSWQTDDIADNACDVINAVLEKIGKEKVAVIYLRTPSSTQIPVYTADISQIITEE